MAREVTVIQKTHLIMQRPAFNRGSPRVQYKDAVACGKNPNTVDTTQVFGEVDCEVCGRYIDKRMGA